MHPTHHIYWSLISAAITGGTAQRALVYAAKHMPPLPANAGWWTQFLYSIMKGFSGHDPKENV